MARAERKRERSPNQAYGHRVERLRGESLKPPVAMHGKPFEHANAVLDCGWGRLLFAQTFESTKALVESIVP